MLGPRFREDARAEPASARSRRRSRRCCSAPPARPRRVSDRPLPHRLWDCDQSHRAQERREGDDLLGELYAGGLGAPQNDVKAADWYNLAADRGDREAMFALAVFRLQGRAGTRDRDAGARWLAAAAKLGHLLAAYDLALLYLEGQLFPQDFTRAAELLRTAAQAGLPEAQYALGTLQKQGRGVAKDMKEATRLWGLAALADNADAQVEFGIASRANVSTDQEYPGTDGLASEQSSLINASRHRRPNLITEAI